MSRGTGRRDMTETLLKTALNPNQSILEVGRTGRSSGETDAILYHNKADVGLPSRKKDMKEYCLNNHTCRRRTINNYLGFETVKTPHNCCAHNTLELIGISIILL